MNKRYPATAVMATVALCAPTALADLTGTTMDLTVSHTGGFGFTESAVHEYGTSTTIEDPAFPAFFMVFSSPGGLPGSDNSILIDFSQFAYTDFTGETGSLLIENIAEEVTGSSRRLVNEDGVKIGTVASGTNSLDATWSVDDVLTAGSGTMLWIGWDSATGPTDPVPCDADLDDSGVVGFGDLIALLAAWGPCAGCPEDIDGDGSVGFSDLLFLLTAWGTDCTVADFVTLELAGKSLSSYPWMNFVRSFNQGSPITVGIDPTQHSIAPGMTGDLYITEPKTAAGWDGDPTLTDVRGGPQTVTFPGPGLQHNRHLVTGALSGDAGTKFGRGYDAVVDMDMNGQLSAGDFIDGYGDEPGFFVVKDTTTLGPLATTQLDYSVTGVTFGFEQERTFYPTGIAGMGQLPLVVISHGNGHQWTWYNYLQDHLASHGYIVMSHRNNTMPGIETSSTTTLQHTDAIIGQQATIGGGVLNGHIDDSRIIWIGHSRGGEGVARAYDRIFDGTFTPSNYGLADIKLISSIAPTDFLGAFSANPHGANYHLLYGAADGDVSGAPNCDICQSFHLLERATGERASTYVQGADHNDFNCCGFDDFSGPFGTAIGRPEAQQVAKGAYLALIKHFIDGDLAAQDYLWRQYEDLRPIGVSPETIVDREYKENPSGSHFIVDDFQFQPSTGTSSSGGSVSFNVLNLTEGLLNDNDSSFTWVVSDPFNGMTRARFGETTAGIVFDYTSNRFLEFEVVAGERDVTDKKYLSFRACQGTRHPQTIAELADITFTVTLRDGSGTTRSINVGAYSGGVEEPYQRTGAGIGAGWQNEFETIRIRLSDFLTNASGLDLTDIAAVRFDFGPSHGSSQGRLGLDDVEFTSP